MSFAVAYVQMWCIKMCHARFDVNLTIYNNFTIWQQLIKYKKKTCLIALLDVHYNVNQ